MTAVISLVAGVAEVTRLVSEVGERRRHVIEPLGVASQQQKSADSSAAWASLNQASEAADQGSHVANVVRRIDRERLAIRAAQEDLAMTWLRDVSVPDRGTFAAAVDPLAAVVTRGIVEARGVRKADLLAFLGWAYFLKSRDGSTSGTPEDAYQEALDLDPANPSRMRTGVT